MNFENMTAEELVQQVWASFEDRTPLERHLATVLAQMLDEHESEENCGDNT